MTSMACQVAEQAPMISVACQVAEHIGKLLSNYLICMHANLMSNSALKCNNSSLEYVAGIMSAEGTENDAAVIMQQPLAGHRAPLADASNVADMHNSRPLQSGAPSQQRRQPARLDEGLSTPQRAPAPQTSMQLFSPLDAHTLARPFAAQIPQDMQVGQPGARCIVQQPANALRVPPALPAAATALAPLPEHNEEHDNSTCRCFSCLTRIWVPEACFHWYAQVKSYL